jgi:hypothetical protein
MELTSRKQALTIGGIGLGCAAGLFYLSYWLIGELSTDKDKIDCGQGHKWTNLWGFTNSAGGYCISETNLSYCIAPIAVGATIGLFGFLALMAGITF